MRRGWLCLGLSLVVLPVAACGDDETASTGAGGQAAGTGGSTNQATSQTSTGVGGAMSGAGGGGTCVQAGPVVESMTTEDGVTLQGDLYTTGLTGAPAVVLLHMIPPNFDRTSYPAAFIGKLTTAGFNVLNLDRRGAGSSGGVAQDAYIGPNGKFDAKAAVDLLVTHPCAIDASRIALVGASNGTTTALDYAIYAATEPLATPAAALVFLTGGGYTEAQNNVSASPPLSTLPIMFAYADNESTWSVQFENGAPAPWSFDEYSPGDHGTALFGAAPASMDDVTSFLSAALP